MTKHSLRKIYFFWVQTRQNWGQKVEQSPYCGLTPPKDDLPKEEMLRQGWCLDAGHNLILTGCGLPICPVNLQISMIMGSLQFFSRAFCRGLQNFATVFVETDNFFQVLFDFFDPVWFDCPKFTGFRRTVHNWL